MAISHPVAVYNARTNLEAHLVRNFLEQYGIEAFAAADESPAGLWMFGLLPEIHKPQVWVDQTNVEQARPLLQEFDRISSEHTSETGSDSATLEAACEDCQRSSTFPAGQIGTVQYCPHCGAHMDVGECSFDEFDS